MSEVVVQVTQEGSPSPEIGERRAWVRFPTSLDGACQPIPLHHASDPANEWQGRVVNLSASGLCLHLVRRFEPGTPLIFELRGPPGGSTYILTGTVARVVGPKGAGWVLGCQFDVPLAAEQLNALLRTTARAVHPRS